MAMTSIARAEAPTTAPAECDQVVKLLFDAAQAGNLKALQAAYTAAAWKQIMAAGTDEDGLDYAARCKKYLRGGTCTIEQSVADSDQAIVTVKLSRKDGASIFRPVLQKTKKGWLIDSNSDATLPLCLDQWTPVVLVWFESFDKVKNVSGHG